MAHSFQWIQGALGIITGLAMTRIAVSASQMFIGRKSVRLDWIPFVWAASIFFLLLQFSWGFVALEGRVEAWSFAIFLSLLCVVLTLFVAAALILPNSEAQAGGDLRGWHSDHGRWAMPFVAVYVLLAYPFNWFFLKSNPLENPASLIIASLALTAFRTRSRRVLTAVTTLQSLATLGMIAEMVAG